MSIIYLKSIRKEKNMLGAFWGLGMIFLLLSTAVYRMSGSVAIAFKYDFSWIHWIALVLNTIFMAVFKGYYVFQNGFSPRVAARARYLVTYKNSIAHIFAPFFCMAYFNAPLRRKLISFSMTALIISFIIILQRIPQPWKGIIIFGVIIGLLWGIISLAIFTYIALNSDDFKYSPEINDK